ncbi:MAG TPA: hypothetical protein VH639_19050 [Bryobacteraceae bacterium]|jgi:hypothetical protein
MQFAVPKACALISGVLAATLCLYSQDAPTPASRPNEALAGIPPRAAPSDYPVQGKAGNVTIAAEFKGHFLPTPEGTLTSEDFVAVEVGMFGAPSAKLTLSVGDFSLRINGKKNPLPSQSYILMASSLKDPEWEPPTPPASKNKTSFSGGGGGGQSDNTPPPPVHVPVETRRGWVARVQKASLAEGDRALPQAGLIYFPYRGQDKSIDSIELTYKGPAGQTTLTLNPR